MGVNSLHINIYNILMKKSGLTQNWKRKNSLIASSVILNESLTRCSFLKIDFDLNLKAYQ